MSFLKPRVMSYARYVIKKDIWKNTKFIPVRAWAKSKKKLKVEFLNQGGTLQP